MKGWALTSVVCESPDRYHDEVTPLTWPLMEKYAARHDMAWQPKVTGESLVIVVEEPRQDVLSV